METNGDMRYTIDNAEVAHQTLDGEVIVIDFVKGLYFSMRGSAAIYGRDWSLLCHWKR